jgi:WD40 repeat protein
VYHLGDDNSSGKSGTDVVLKGHDAEGYRLAWSPMKEGLMLSGSYDNKMCLWDLAAQSGASVLYAQQVFEVTTPLASCCPIFFISRVIHKHNWSFLCHTLTT